MSTFFPQILPEDPVPHFITDTERHELQSHSKSRLVWGEGNPLAPIFVVLDNPGSRENKLGEPFLCGTRETLQKGAHDAGIGTKDFYVSYLLKARPIGKYDKDRARSLSRKYLFDQIKRHQPKIVFCLGNVAVQSYFDNPELSVKELRGHYHDVNYFKTVVSYHPLAARRRPALYRHLVQDWMLVVSDLTIDGESRKDSNL